MNRAEAVSMSEAGRRLGVSRQRIHQLVGYGMLRATKRGGRRMVFVESIDEHLARKITLVDDCMSTVEVAAHFEVDQKTVRGWRDRGLLTTTKINNRLCFSREQVERFIPPATRMSIERARRAAQDPTAPQS